MVNRKMPLLHRVRKVPAKDEQESWHQDCIEKAY